jgi:nucleoside-diphosphate-sugar epimerase
MKINDNEFKNDLVLVAGAGGFIGGWLVRNLIERGYTKIRAVDLKPKSEWYQEFPEVENIVLDLQGLGEARLAAKDTRLIYNLAADMGGMGFIENNKAACMLSVLINTHLLMAAKEFDTQRFFYASSACVYNGLKQLEPNNPGLKEEDAYPALPEDGYGWEKLFSERMCTNFSQDYGIETRIARYHNVYGPNGTFEGGREKAPAAICRKVAQAKISGNYQIDIWGDGEQTRSFTFVDDTVLGTQLIMHSGYTEPLNLGSTEMVSINELVGIVEEIANIQLKRNYDLAAPKGVRGRNSENTKIKDEIGWEPSIRLSQGLEITYEWIFNQLISQQR